MRDRVFKPKTIPVKSKLPVRKSVIAKPITAVFVTEKEK
jgi:hypothetical protein